MQHWMTLCSRLQNLHIVSNRIAIQGFVEPFSDSLLGRPCSRIDGQRGQATVKRVLPHLNVQLLGHVPESHKFPFIDATDRVPEKGRLEDLSDQGQRDVHRKSNLSWYGRRFPYLSGQILSVLVLSMLFFGAVSVVQFGFYLGARGPGGLAPLRGHGDAHGRPRNRGHAPDTEGKKIPGVKGTP